MHCIVYENNGSDVRVAGERVNLLGYKGNGAEFGCFADILAKAAASIFSSMGSEISPTTGNYDDNPLQVTFYVNFINVSCSSRIDAFEYNSQQESARLFNT